ncbi:MFS general substrate transporter [Thozetella sp. PMI_491]|nr:MFS general substrate transporter [Thozetella sp. PMI_491]
MEDGGQKTPSPGTVTQEEEKTVAAQGLKRVTLIPHPSDDPRDPLNWPAHKKYAQVAILSLGAFAGFSGSLAGQLEVGPLSDLYKQSTTALTYQNSAATSGMIIGSILLYWLSRLIGRQATMLWSLIGALGAAIWAAFMTDKSDYQLFIISRGFAGLFANIVGVLGPRCLIDMFFLHQRGRAFTIFHFFFDLASAAGPSICALVASPSGDWRWALWFSIIVIGVAIILFFAFMQDTTWHRKDGVENNPPSTGWLASRVATFLPGTAITPRVPAKQFIHDCLIPFKIALTPVAIVLGVFTLLNFGFFIAMNSVTPAWLQKPIKAGGYGFTPFQNALFQIFHWVGILLALPYGQLVSDRVPLWFAARYDRGSWKPEFRLHALWLPALVCNPIGLGIFGYGLQQHLHWAVLGVAQILVTYGSLCITPVTVNYLSECFTKNIEETAIVLNAFRISLGLSIAFYVNQWVSDVGFAWCYGTMAFIQVFSWFFVLLLLWKGHEIRQYDPFRLISTEEGEHIIDGSEAASVTGVRTA